MLKSLEKNTKYNTEGVIFSFCEKQMNNTFEGIRSPLPFQSLGYTHEMVLSHL